MFSGHRQRILGYAMVLLFAVNTSFQGMTLPRFITYSNSFYSKKIDILAAPYLVPTSYPPPPTSGPPTDYPAPGTPTYPPYPPTSFPTSSTKTLIPTVSGSGSFTPTPQQTGTGISLTIQPGTPLATSTTGNDLFLTENAEMGQSRATQIPTDIPSASPTTTISPVPINSTPTVVLDQSFKMNWGAFIIGFLTIIGIGGVIGWWFIRGQGSRT